MKQHNKKVLKSIRRNIGVRILKELANVEK